MDRDLELAISLQFEEENAGGAKAKSVMEQKGMHENQNDRPLSIVDESWELIDPVPNIHELFLQFNAAYFENILAGVEVKWSPRMTLCAGLCSYEGRGGLCSVRLSLPLLKLRPRRDLVQTLLHEMIHALLFVTQNNKDHDGHGPEFHKHMDRINKKTGAKITVYHTFHEEVNQCRQHWWQCDGPCRKRSPYFGIVRRAMNRAPSRHDTWWADHQRTCGGKYTKIKEPDDYGKKNAKRKRKDNTDDNALDKSVLGTTNKMPFTGTCNKLGGNETSSLLKWFPSNSNKLIKKTVNHVGNPGSSKSQDCLNEDNTKICPQPDENAEPACSDNTNCLFPGKGHLLGSRTNIDKSKYRINESRTLPKFTKVEKSKTSVGLGKLTSETSSKLDTKSDKTLTKNSITDMFSKSKTSNKKRYAEEISELDQSIKNPLHVENKNKKRATPLINDTDNKNGLIFHSSTHLKTSVESQESNSKGTKSTPIFVDQQSPIATGSRCVECPSCPLKIPESQINQHLDQCLLKCTS